VKKQSESKPFVMLILTPDVVHASAPETFPLEATLTALSNSSRLCDRKKICYQFSETSICKESTTNDTIEGHTEKRAFHTPAKGSCACSRSHGLEIVHGSRL
jgi:hypothetical protein